MQTSEPLQPHVQLRPQAQLVVKPRLLTLEELETLNLPSFQIQNGFFVLERSLRSWKLREPVSIPLRQILETGEPGLVRYVFQAFASERPRLLPFAFANKSVLRLARHLLRRKSGSPLSLYTYTDAINRYATYLGHSPDMIINDVKAGGNIPDPVRVQNHTGLLDDFAATLQDLGLSPGRVHGLVKAVRSLYRQNGVDIKLAEPLSRRIIYKDRSPTPEELQRLLQIANLRGRVIITVLALGGFREGTLAKLTYAHVREDLEAGRVPVHVHVESNITKGKFGDYSTFLAAEAVEYLRLYMDERRRGSSDHRAPPEEITDESPMIRDMTSHQPQPITPKQIRKIVHAVYAKAGLLKKTGGRMFELRVHSLRKYFKTQLIAAGVPESYVDYWMGHVTDTYHDIASLGAEKLRQVYQNANLSIRPKTKTSKMETIKEMIRALGENPEAILTREALAEGATTQLDNNQLQDHYTQLLTKTLRELLQQNAKGLTTTNSTNIPHGA